MSLQSSVVCVDADAEHAAMPVHEHELLLDQANHDLLHSRLLQTSCLRTQRLTLSSRNLRLCLWYKTSTVRDNFKLSMSLDRGSNLA